MREEPQRITLKDNNLKNPPSSIFPQNKHEKQCRKSRSKQPSCHLFLGSEEPLAFLLTTTFQAKRSSTHWEKFSRIRLGIDVICGIIIQAHELSQFSLARKGSKKFQVYKLNDYNFENPSVFLGLGWSRWWRTQVSLMVWT